MKKPENPFQQSVLEMHPMNQVPYHVGHSMGLLNVNPQHDLYCSATQARSYRLFHQGWSDGRVLAESRLAFVELPSQPVQDLAARVAQAVAQDGLDEGCDAGAGVLGTSLKALVTEMAGHEAEAYALQDQVDEANSSITALEQQVAELEQQVAELEGTLREVLGSGDWFRTALEFHNGDGLERQAWIAAALEGK